MLEIKNTSDRAGLVPKVVTITSRNLQGQDGQATSINPGETATIAIDANNQAVLSTTGLEEGEVGLAHAPQAVIKPEDDGSSTDASDASETSTSTALPVASDEQVSEILAEIRAAGQEVTLAGKPENGAVNARLTAAGLATISAARRDELFDKLPPKEPPTA